MFAIYFTKEPAFPLDGDGPLHRAGVTVLGHDRDCFDAPLSFWREGDYEAQWREGVERLVAGAESSALVTRMEDPDDEQILRFWALYRLDQSVAVHEQLWVPEFGRLQPEEVYGAVGSYRAENDDGHQVSEWRLPVADFADYLSARA